MTGGPGVAPQPRRPDPPLRGLVDGYHGYDYEVSEPGVHRGLPSSVATIVLALDRPLDVGWFGRPATRSQHWALASGLSVGPAEIYHEGAQRGIQLGLTAIGARVLLGLPLGALADDLVPLEAVGPGAVGRWHVQVAAQPTWTQRYDTLDRLLLQAVADRDDRLAPRPRPELTRAWSR